MLASNNLFPLPALVHYGSNHPTGVACGKRAMVEVLPFSNCKNSKHQKLSDNIFLSLNLPKSQFKNTERSPPPYKQLIKGRPNIMSIVSGGLKAGKSKTPSTARNNQAIIKILLSSMSRNGNTFHGEIILLETPRQSNLE